MSTDSYSLCAKQGYKTRFKVKLNTGIVEEDSMYESWVHLVSRQLKDAPLLRYRQQHQLIKEKEKNYN